MKGECHCHIFMNGYDYKKAAALHKNGPHREDIREHLRAYQEAGVTFIRDGGDRFGASLYAREIAAEYGIDYRTPAFAIHKRGHYGGIVGRPFDSWKDFMALIEEAKRLRADFIKVMVSGILDFSRLGQMTEEPLPPEEIREMIHIIHEEGFAAMVHANGEETVKACARAGADSIEHGNYIGREAIEAMAQAGTVWVPTIATIKNLSGSGRFPEEEVEKIYEQAARSVRQAEKSGALLAAGSDGGAYRVFHGRGILDETEILESLLGEKASEVLEEGLAEIKRKFVTVQSRTLHLLQSS